jgi:hypothetical protein
MLRKDTKFNLILILLVPAIMGLLAFFWPKFTEIKKDRELKQIQSNSKLVSADASKTESKNADKKIPDEEFKNWVRLSVKNLEIPIKDPILSEQNTKDFVNQLSDNQILELTNKVISSELAMNERIFSNYALTLYAGADANQILNDLINTKMPDFQNPQPHSEDEVKRGQEYSLKYMDIDALFMRAEDGDSSAKELLAQISQNHPDSKIRNYAQRKLQEFRK